MWVEAGKEEDTANQDRTSVSATKWFTTELWTRYASRLLMCFMALNVTATNVPGKWLIVAATLS